MLARLSSAIAASIVLAGVVAASGACSSDSDPGATGSSSGSTSSGAGSSGSSSPKLDSAECKSRCTAKLVTECHAPSDQATPGCDQTCSAGVTEAQATCLEAASCDDLEKLANGGIEDLCPSSGSSSSGSSSGQSSSGQSSSGGANDTPTSLTITATIPSDYKAIHTETDGKIASLFNVAPQPTFDPDVEINSGHLPQLDKATSVTLESPDRPDGACGTSSFSFVLNSSQIGVQIAGVDTLPATDCATFTDDLVQGAKLTLKGVPWNNSTVKATVTIILK